MLATDSSRNLQILTHPFGSPANILEIRDEWSTSSTALQHSRVHKAVHESALHRLLLFEIQMGISDCTKDCLCTRGKGLDAVGSVILASPGTAVNRLMSWEEAELG